MGPRINRMYKAFTEDDVEFIKHFVENYPFSKAYFTIDLDNLIELSVKHGAKKVQEYLEGLKS